MALVGLIVPRPGGHERDPAPLAAVLHSRGVPSFTLPAVPEKIGRAWHDLASQALAVAPPGSWGLFLHPDTVPAPDACAVLEKAMEGGPALLVMTGTENGNRFEYDWWESAPDRRQLRYDEEGTLPYPFTGGFALPLQTLISALPHVPFEKAGWGAGANIALAHAVTSLQIPVKLVGDASYDVPPPRFRVQEAP